MQPRRKTFRVEVTNRGEARPASGIDPGSSARHHEIMAELRALRTMIEPQAGSDRQADEPQAGPDRQADEPQGVKFGEVRKLKTELDLIHDAINRTKQEIATLHVTGFEGPEMARVTHELDAIMGGTEQATEKILSAAEFIDQTANTLSAVVKTEHDQALAHDIQERVIQIFEACNFQDLTGQRITKVVATLKFIEQHINQMIDIWGGIEAFKYVTPQAMAEREGNKSLVNGPRLAEEAGHASQDEIDAMFA